MSLGGQRRTIRSNCGWGCSGHLPEVNKKFKFHQRHCKECKDAKIEIPEWKLEEAMMNGWNGLSGKNKVNEINTVAFVDGERKEFLVKGVRDVNGLVMTSLLPGFLARDTQDPPVLTKSQKKRLMKKNKKVKEEEYHIVSISAEEQEENDKTANIYS
jgi:hypothetical protein